MVHIYTEDTKESIGSFIDEVKTRASEMGYTPNNIAILAILVKMAQELGEKRAVELGVKKGDEYQLHYGESEIMGELLFVHGVVGEKVPIGIEFDCKCFVDLGFTHKDMLEASTLFTMVANRRNN